MNLGGLVCWNLGSKMLLGNQNQVVLQVGFAADTELLLLPPSGSNVWRKSNEFCLLVLCAVDLCVLQC